MPRRHTASLPKIVNMFCFFFSLDPHTSACATKNKNKFANKKQMSVPEALTMQMGHVEQGRAYKALQKPQEEKERAERVLQQLVRQRQQSRHGRRVDEASGGSMKRRRTRVWAVLATARWLLAP